MNKNNLKGSIIILIVAMIWGSNFIMQRKGAALVGPYTFTFFRSFIAVVCLFFLSLITNKKIPVKETNKKVNVYIIALLSGLALFLGSILQQIGLGYITASKSGFLSALYILMVPIMTLFLGKKIKIQVLICVFISLFGSYFLSTTSGFDFSKGELITILSAFFFALQIILVDIINDYINPFRFCMIQFIVVTIFSFIMMMVKEEVVWDNVLQALPYIAYAGILSSSIAFSLQIIGQKYAEPTVASLLMSLESVFSLICGTIFLHERMANREIIGAILIFLSVILSQLPYEKWFKKKEKMSN